MKNILIDLNILLDYYENERRERCPDSVRAFDYLRNKDFAFISSSSIDNFEYLKYDDLSKAYPEMPRRQKLMIVHRIIKEILSFFKIAKTPSYIDIDFEDIEDSLIVASAKPIDAVVLTQDKRLLEKYPDLTTSPREFLEQLTSDSKTNIPMLDLTRETYYIYSIIEKNVDSVINKSNFILGEGVKQLEEEIAKCIGTKYARGVSSGTAALVLSLRALALTKKKQEYWNKEDLIITTSFTFTATGDAILRSGATPLFVDIDLESYNINPELVEKAVKQYGNRVKGIVPVHLYGYPCDMDYIIKIAKGYDLFVVEDCAQSFGAKWDDKQTGSFGDTGCFSFFPSKNLGGFGDAGAVTTNDDQLAELIRMLRVHGGKDKYNVEHIGYNARLDTIQAAILLAKMKYVNEFNQRRRAIAEIYNRSLSHIEEIQLPIATDSAYHVYHQYTIKVKNGKRKALLAYLKGEGIDTMVYYPVPLHKMKVFNGRFKCIDDLANTEDAASSVLSLPIEPLFGEEEINRVVGALIKFFKENKEVVAK